MSGKLSYDSSNLSGFVGPAEIRAMESEIRKAHDFLEKRNGPGKDFLGWMDLPERYDESSLLEIQKTATNLAEKSDLTVIIGIGGSYLGSRALIEAVSSPEMKGRTVFSGYNLSGAELESLLSELKRKDFSVNVISKSGTTTEPAIAFRLIESLVVEKYGLKGASERIVCTTDRDNGALREIAREKGYKSFDVPRDVGGRFSVLSAVGLFPAAAAGVDILSLMKGARDQKLEMSVMGVTENPAYIYAASRNALYRKGKAIELFSVFESLLSHTAEWWKQLFGESEGKSGRGIFPSECNFSKDLHAVGQLIQDGERNIFETFLIVEKEVSGCAVPFLKDDSDGLNYLAGKKVDEINRKAYEATARAHYAGGVPNSTIFIDERSAYCMGKLFYFLETAAAVSAYISGVNPFDQPGVEAYKKEMFRLLGKPGA